MTTSGNAPSASTGETRRVKRRPIPAAMRCNRLDGAKWLQYSLSVWSDIRKSAEEQHLKHPALFPAALAERLIQTLLRPDGRVILDPFMGSGSTILAARDAGHHGLGFELSPEYVALAQRRLGQAGGTRTSGSFEIRQGDARRLAQS